MFLKPFLIIGGGYIGAEFAYVYNSFGSKVIIVEMEDHILPGADEEVAKELQKIFTKNGMKIHTNTKYKSLKTTRHWQKLLLKMLKQVKKKC